jgi:hypothetical protein
MSEGPSRHFLCSSLRAAAQVVRWRGTRMAAVLLLCLAPTAGAFDPQPVTKIEEDWEIQIAEPSPDEVLPQLYVVTTPTGNLEGQYSVFEINNLLLPEFYGGGLQFQTWWGDQPTGEAHHDDYKAFATTGETVTFTVSMRVFEGSLSFRVKNGQSSTWGTFGDNASLRILRPTNVSDLSAYSPDVSTRLSRVGSGRGRVTKFVLKQVRYYNGSTLLSTDTTPRDAQIDEPE